MIKRHSLARLVNEERRLVIVIRWKSVEAVADPGGDAAKLLVV